MKAWIRIAMLVTLTVCGTIASSAKQAVDQSTPAAGAAAADARGRRVLNHQRHGLFVECHPLSHFWSERFGRGNIDAGNRTRHRWAERVRALGRLARDQREHGGQQPDNRRAPEVPGFHGFSPCIG